MNSDNDTAFDVRIEAEDHRGADGNIQHFTMFTVVTDASPSSSYDGRCYSDWITAVDGKLFVPAESSDVDYCAEFEGEDIALVPMTRIDLPAVDARTMPLAKKMAQRLREVISETFQIPCNYPIVKFYESLPEPDAGQLASDRHAPSDGFDPMS